ncbi:MULTISPECIES: AMP-binding protein [Arsenicicoccus]|uniref:AMP-binding protein n=1 Tax=Arsenicicoccus TaxID=267408 RepID=UPI00257F5863|nr:MULTISPECIES: AMP-binding protein [Arsenicicoccus]
MTTSTDRPWLSLYRQGVPAEIDAGHGSVLAAFAATVARDGGAPAIRYFDGVLTYADLDARSSALAAHLVDEGFAAGDRLAVYTQNDPAFVVALLAAWKARGVAVMVNPMNKTDELAYLLGDSGATALVCLDELWESVAAPLVGSGATQVRCVITVAATDDQTRDDTRVMSTTAGTSTAGAVPLREILDRARATGGVTLPRAEPGSDEVAVLTYTSGTTGEPKGAMNTHGNLVVNAEVYRTWMDLGPDDVVLGVAPLFHITGLVGHVCLSLLAGASLVLTHRFDAAVMVDAMREHRPTFTVGSVTAFIALSGVDGIARDDWSSFRSIYSGGAPIAPAVADRFEAATGHYLHNIYGLTETSSPSHAVPRGARAPVDPGSGALSVGVPVCGTTVRVLGDDGEALPPGEAGELATSGPQVVPGYWQRPEATAEGIRDGELRTGDVGIMTPEGWFFLVDRKKDMINAAGYKVWPREVEDVLYSHDAVREVAVVGVPDDYRGETVKAFVSLVPGVTVTGEEIVAWARERMAAYKYPRAVEIVDELPKTTTGKILRRQLRDTQEQAP